MSYKLLEVVLSQSSFKRAKQLNFQGIDHVFDINISHNTENQTLFTSVKVELRDGIDTEKPLLHIIIEMLGIFDIGENPQFPSEQFAQINAPAIIFPFIREHLASLTLKGGLNPPILLPPINFVKMAEEQNKK